MTIAEATAPIRVAEDTRVRSLEFMANNEEREKARERDCGSGYGNG